jgi:hypothetical protein
VTAEGLFFVSDGQNQGAIQLQGRYRGPPRRCQSDEPNALPPKMLLPNICAGIIKRYFSATLWINGDAPRSLAQRTRDTGQREVALDRRATRDARIHVIEVKGRLLACLSQTTVFTPLLGALDHEPS